MSGRGRLAAAVRWLGAGGEALELRGRVVVLSPHLDDAVFSLGAALARASRGGARVTALTVLAGEPASTAPAGPWDARAGFRTAGRAAVARREEDQRACELVGAEVAWLPFGDADYGHGADDATIWGAIREHLAAADTVLVPGFPLMHPDHAWLAHLVAERGEGLPAARYVEQPYAALWTDREPASGGGRWTTLAASASERAAKIRACRAYVSQLPLLGARPLWRLTRYEVARAGEAALWPAGQASAYLRDRGERVEEH